MKFNLHDADFAESETAPQKIAVIAPDGCLSWASLREKVESLGQQFRSISLHREQPVLLLGEGEASFIAAVLACLQYGVPYVPLDRKTPVKRRQQIIESAGIHHVLDCRPGGEFHLSSCGPSPSAAPLRRETAYLIFTSGSTGEPKGVPISRENILDFADWIISDGFFCGGDDVVLSHAAFSFDAFLLDVIPTLGSGATLLLHRSQEFSQEERKASVWSSTPSLLSRYLLDPEFCESSFPYLKRFHLYAEVLEPSLCERLWKKFPAARIWNLYGPTECTIIVTRMEVTPDLLRKYKTAPLGRVKMGSQIEVNEEGELIISGLNVAHGYLHNVEPEKFFLKNGQRAFHSGDLGFEQDGLLFFSGRKDDQVKLHGYRIELAEISHHIARLSGARRVITLPIVTRGIVKRLVSFVESPELAATEATSLEKTLREGLAEVLPRPMIPSELLFLAQFPLNEHQKVDRAALLRALHTSTG